MPEAARILPFRRRQVTATLSREDVALLARRFLDTPLQDRPAGMYEEAFSCPEVLFGVCALLRDRSDSSPRQVADEVFALYRRMNESDRVIGIFDERDYLLGEIALIGGAASRHLGKLEESERWLDRADSAFRHTVNPAPVLARVAYARLALRYDQRRYDDVLELLPSLVASFERLGMRNEVAKSRFLEAMTLKEAGRLGEAIAKFEKLRGDLSETGEPSLLGMVLVEVAAAYCVDDRYAEALPIYEQAAAVLSEAGVSMTAAHLKGVIGETYRLDGNLAAAAAAYRDALRQYLELGMAVRIAYYRVLLAETLIAADRHREAEWEILAALPTIEEQKMVPEGLAAVALLRESVRRRKTDPEALRQLREHLQARQ